MMGERGKEVPKARGRRVPGGFTERRRQSMNSRKGTGQEEGLHKAFRCFTVSNRKRKQR
jgi:hypothetical protein